MSPSGNYGPHRSHHRVHRTKTEDPTGRPQRRRTSKTPAAPSSRRSAPAAVQLSFVYPPAPLSHFLHLTVELSLNAQEHLNPPTAAYHDAITTRLNQLVADSILTTNQTKLLTATISIAQSFVAPGDVHVLLHTIASLSTPVSEILRLIAIIDVGMRAFVARPGPSSTVVTTVSSNSSTTSRSDSVRTACAARDNRQCLVTGTDIGACCHIIPYSVRGEKAEHFWAFVAMFKGATATQHLKTLTLGPQPSSTDNIRNVLWLSPDAHAHFDSGKLAIVPVIASDYATYDPATVSQYTAHVELPYGAQSIKLVVWTTSDDGGTQIEVLKSGHALTLRTSDPATLPLPHPLLLQLHTAFTRLRQMCASAGIPILASNCSDSDGEELMGAVGHDNSSEQTSQAMLDDHEKDAPCFPDNDRWPASTGGLPLKERFLQLMCGSEASEVEQFHNVMDHWNPYDETESDGDMHDIAKRFQVVPERKRVFELFERDCDTVSEKSRPATEEARSKRRWDGQRRFGALGAGGDTESV